LAVGGASRNDSVAIDIVWIWNTRIIIISILSGTDAIIIIVDSYTTRAPATRIKSFASCAGIAIITWLTYKVVVEIRADILAVTNPI